MRAALAIVGATLLIGVGLYAGLPIETRGFLAAVGLFLGGLAMVDWDKPK